MNRLLARMTGENKKIASEWMREGRGRGVGKKIFHFTRARPRIVHAARPTRTVMATQANPRSRLVFCTATRAGRAPPRAAARPAPPSAKGNRNFLSLFSFSSHPHTPPYVCFVGENFFSFIFRFAAILLARGGQAGVWKSLAARGGDSSCPVPRADQTADCGPRADQTDSQNHRPPWPFLPLSFTSVAISASVAEEIGHALGPLYIIPALCLGGNLPSRCLPSGPWVMVLAALFFMRWYTSFHYIALWTIVISYHHRRDRGANRVSGRAAEETKKAGGSSRAAWGADRRVIRRRFF